MTDIRYSMICFYVVLFVAGMTKSLVHAELDPTYYASLQRNAPESLAIQIQRTIVSRIKESDVTHCKVRVESRIVAIQRSSSNLKLGDCIVIEYETEERTIPIVGPSQLPIVEVGKTYPAFLARSNQKCVFAPAARGWSFHEVVSEPNIPKPSVELQK